jgi:hypothetical protein
LKEALNESKYISEVKLDEWNLGLGWLLDRTVKVVNNRQGSIHMNMNLVVPIVNSVQFKKGPQINFE